MAQNGPQVAEGGYTQTLKRSTDMENETNTPNEEQTGRLQQPVVMGRGTFLRPEGHPANRWFCTGCGQTPSSIEVTFCEEHDPRYGG